nr:Tm-1-like ATP-binding domain-containing protein [Streptomyces sp. CBMA29]
MVVAATLDTKGPAVRVLLDELRRRHCPVLLIDTGTGAGLGPGAPRAVASDITADQVEQRGLAVLGSVQGSGRDRLPALGAGLAAIVDDLRHAHGISGLLAIGGGTGASIAAPAIRRAPVGFPRMLVSTGVTDDVSALVGVGDIHLVQPVVDFHGDSDLLEVVLRRAAAAMAAVVSLPYRPTTDRPQVGVTSFGVTEAAVARVVTGLERRGLRVCVFHARGSGGRAMEAMIDQGALSAVIDLTTTEVTDEVAGGARSAGPRRLEAALRAGIPCVLAPGAIDVINYGPPETVPAELAGRATVRHSPTTTLVRASAADSEAVAEYFAARIGLARHPERVRVVVPSRGFSALDATGQPFFDPVADGAFTVRLRRALPGTVPIREVDAHLTDETFAAAVLAEFDTVADFSCGTADTGGRAATAATEGTERSEPT